MTVSWVEVLVCLGAFYCAGCHVILGLLTCTSGLTMSLWQCQKWPWLLPAAGTGKSSDWDSKISCGQQDPCAIILHEVESWRGQGDSKCIYQCDSPFQKKQIWLPQGCLFFVSFCPILSFRAAEGNVAHTTGSCLQLLAFNQEAWRCWGTVILQTHEYELEICS